MATKTRVTLEEFLALPDSEPGSEYIDGEVIEREMGDEPHSTLTAVMWSILNQWLSTNSIGRVQIEYRCIFGPVGGTRAFVPDVLVVTHERRAAGIAARPANVRSKHLYAAPNIAIEIMSPEQSASRFAEKIQFYLAHGVDVTWVIDPIEETVTVFRRGEDSRSLQPGDVLDEPTLLPGFSLPVEEIFARIREDENG